MSDGIENQPVAAKRRNEREATVPDRAEFFL